jgi:hypothetical protein
MEAPTQRGIPIDRDLDRSTEDALPPRARSNNRLGRPRTMPDPCPRRGLSDGDQQTGEHHGAKPRKGPTTTVPAGRPHPHSTIRHLVETIAHLTLATSIPSYTTKKRSGWRARDRLDRPRRSVACVGARWRKPRPNARTSQAPAWRQAAPKDPWRQPNPRGGGPEQAVASHSPKLGRGRPLWRWRRGCTGRRACNRRRRPWPASTRAFARLLGRS